MNIDELVRYAWNNGMSSYHDTKTSKQLKVEEDDFMDSIEFELKKLRVGDVSGRSEQLIDFAIKNGYIEDMPKGNKMGLIDGFEKSINCH